MTVVLCDCQRGPVISGIADLQTCTHVFDDDDRAALLRVADPDAHDKDGGLGVRVRVGRTHR
jgi:hypothetical protein